MRFFSLRFMLLSFYLGARYPSIMVDTLKGRNIRASIHEKRSKDWEKTRSYYAEHPKKVFGLWMYLNPDDFSPVSTSIATTGWLDLPLTTLLKKILRPGMLVVDVGANIGYYTLLFSKTVGKTGKVYSFEPESLNIKLLSKSIDANHLDNVELKREVLSDSHGMATLFLSDPREPQGHSLVHDLGKGAIITPSTTLDDFWESVGKPPFDLIKIHVSGADDLVLAGARRLIRDLRPYLTFVFTSQRWKTHLIELETLFDNYEVLEVVQGPRLGRKIDLQTLLKRDQVEVFLVPRR
ncbi:MAG TPA: FkbM family methyltransferase [Nitrososphaerales archaeon]|nr:FkbM family methyltransferase [Nitrososphaerales archaeon]